MTDLMNQARIGIIGGSGLQKLLALTDIQRVELETPFGTPSDAIVLGLLHGIPVAFLQRHGAGHRIPPSEINVRANIAALRRVGCTQILSLSAVGSLTQSCPPGSFVIIDQFIDRTIAREKTFFGTGLVGHVPFGDPVCGRMQPLLGAVARKLGYPAQETGTYIVMEGPQFSTRAESNMHRMLGGTVIGMTGMPEAKLAREAEICYAMIAMVTDFDCWHTAHEAVTAQMVSERMGQIGQQANLLVEEAVRALSQHQGACHAGCNHALDSAIMTAPAARDPAMLARLAFVAPRIMQNKELRIKNKE